MNNDVEQALQIASEKTRIPKEELTKLIHAEFDEGVLPRFLKLANIPFAKELIEEITAESKEVFSLLDPQLVGRAKDTLRLIIYNLVVCTFTRSRLSLPGSKEAYDKGSYHRKLHFTRNSVKGALRALDKYLISKPGNTYTNQVDSYEPNTLFQLKLIPLLYYVYLEYDKDTDLIVIQHKKNKEFNKIIYSNNELEGIKANHIMRVNPSLDLDRTYQEDWLHLIMMH